MVFQDLASAHMTVRTTLDFVLRGVGCRPTSGPTGPGDAHKAPYKRSPGYLPTPGGQQQLLAGRALITSRVILMDEPLASLDVASRAVHRDLLRLVR